MFAKEHTFIYALQSLYSNMAQIGPTGLQCKRPVTFGCMQFVEVLEHTSNRMSLIELCGRCFYIGIPFGVSSKINEHHMDTYKQMVSILMYESHVCEYILSIQMYTHIHIYTRTCSLIRNFHQYSTDPTPDQISKSENRQGIDSYLNISDYMQFDIFYLYIFSRLPSGLFKRENETCGVNYICQY